jgi:magnesium-protoporphyrin O-methyltransferase
MPSCHCAATDRHFTPARAHAELAQYRRRGPRGTARLILESLSDLGVTPQTLLDIGAGIGVLHHELLGRGVGRAVHLEAAAAYVAAAEEEAVRRGHGGRVRFHHGDFVSLAPELGSAELVTLDRVVCCFPELDPLVSLSAAKAERYYALSFPHDRWYVRAHTRWQNHWRQRAGNAFRTFVHPSTRIEALVRAAGFQVQRSRRTPVWAVLVCTRRNVSSDSSGSRPVRGACEAS